MGKISSRSVHDSLRLGEDMGQSRRQEKPGKIFRRPPDDFARFGACPALSVKPEGGERQNDIVTLDPPGKIPDDMLNGLVEADQSRQYSGFFAQLSQRGRFERLSDLDEPTRQGEKIGIRRSGAARQQDLALAKDRYADGQSGLGRKMTARLAHGYRCSQSQSPSGAGRVKRCLSCRRNGRSVQNSISTGRMR